tara:strand:- start:1710 stop:1994 length:285 start_codon:yes stop_codon:yes gene_type:complete
MLFTTLKKILNRAVSYARVLERLDALERALEPLAATAAENEELWSYLDQKDEDFLQSAGYHRPESSIFVGDSPEDLVSQISDNLLKVMKTQGDA